MIGALVLGTLVGTFVCFAVLAVLAWVTDNRDYTCHPGTPAPRGDTEPTRLLIFDAETLRDAVAGAIAEAEAADDLADDRIFATVEQWRAEQ